MIEAIEYFNNLPAQGMFAILFGAAIPVVLFVLVGEVINWWRGGCGDE